MLRRRLAPEPFAVSATGSRSCALFGCVLAVLAVLMGRSGGVDPRGTLAVLGFALLFALAGVALAVWSAGVIWRTGRRGTGRALSALVVAAIVLAYPAYLAERAATRSAVADASTDPATPPAFSSAPAALAARGGAAHDDPPLEAREAERRAYPNLGPVMLDVPVEEAFDIALKAVQGRGWRVIEAAPPQGKFGTGHIDAVAPTRVLALPDDVAIRVRPASGQARVDIRSASRFFRADAGENAARIQSLADEIGDAAS